MQVDIDDGTSSCWWVARCEAWGGNTHRIFITFYYLPMSISDLEVDKFDGNIESAVSRIQNFKSNCNLHQIDLLTRSQ